MSPPVALLCSRLDNKIIGQTTGGGKFQISLARPPMNNLTCDLRFQHVWMNAYASSHCDASDKEWQKVSGTPARRTEGEAASVSRENSGVRLLSAFAARHNGDAAFLMPGSPLSP